MKISNANRSTARSANRRSSHSELDAKYADRMVEHVERYHIGQKRGPRKPKPVTLPVIKSLLKDLK